MFKKEEKIIKFIFINLAIKKKYSNKNIIFILFFSFNNFIKYKIYNYLIFSYQIFCSLKIIFYNDHINILKLFSIF